MWLRGERCRHGLNTMQLLRGSSVNMTNHSADWLARQSTTNGVNVKISGGFIAALPIARWRSCTLEQHSSVDTTTLGGLGLNAIKSRVWRQTWKICIPSEQPGTAERQQQPGILIAQQQCCSAAAEAAYTNGVSATSAEAVHATKCLV